MFKDLRTALLAEFTGTAALLCAVIGSGIMAEQLAGGNVAVATGGLVFVILRTLDTRVNDRASGLVACYIGAAYWFTASTSFANPAAVLGRMLTNSFAGLHLPVR